jgi:hypothetical protein
MSPLQPRLFPGTQSAGPDTFLRQPRSKATYLLLLPRVELETGVLGCPDPIWFHVKQRVEGIE